MRTVDLQTAKTLQKLGYDGEYAEDIPCTKELDGELQWFPIPAPRLDDAAYWIREKFGLNIRISFWQTDEWFYDILNIETGEYYDELYEYYDSYDNALEAGVKQALTIINNKL